MPPFTWPATASRDLAPTPALRPAKRGPTSKTAASTSSGCPKAPPTNLQLVRWAPCRMRHGAHRTSWRLVGGAFGHPDDVDAAVLLVGPLLAGRSAGVGARSLDAV